MSEKPDAYISPDAIIDKLYEAAPKLEWHVSTDAAPIIMNAMEFVSRDPFGFYWHDKPSSVIGVLRGAPVWLDTDLHGKCIELRDRTNALSIFTLE